MPCWSHSAKVVQAEFWRRRRRDCNRASKAILLFLANNCDYHSWTVDWHDCNVGAASDHEHASGSAHVYFMVCRAIRACVVAIRFGDW